MARGHLVEPAYDDFSGRLIQLSADQDGDGRIDQLTYLDGNRVLRGEADTDGDGRSDKREVVLTGFGVQDSHLFPHQFTRAPGNWLWFAQGAFNYGKVKTTGGKEVQFDQTRMARFRPDGSDFDITSQGPCNIWGLHMTMEGETWIQEANDYGYPTMPFHEYANYPGCSQAQWKSYAPEFPGTAPHFAMGGTGLSGVALTDRTGWPEAYAGVIYIADAQWTVAVDVAASPDGSVARTPTVFTAGPSPAVKASCTSSGRRRFSSVSSWWE